MYDRHLTLLAVEEASAKQGWPLTPHTVADVRAAMDHFDRLLSEDTGQPIRPLTPDETRFIQNERRLSGLDFVYWATRYGHLIDWRKEHVIFTPNVAQHIVLDIWADLERRGLAIMMQQLKARQLGMTTFTELAVAHRVQFRKRTKAVVASADPKKTVEMGQMIRFCWEEQPWWMLPSSPKDRVEKGMTVEFADLNSSILIQAGNQFHGVARGQTPNVAHLSEVSSWDNAADDIDASLLRAIHETPDVFVILESTALGRDNWWYDNWQIIKEDWPRGRSRMCPLFLPWFVGTDIYPTTTELRARPVPADWIPSDRTIHHAERARQYVRANPLLTKYLAKGRSDWTMPREQLWFYEVERETAVKKKTLNKFLAEMPADDQEAFQSTGRSVVDQDVILIYREKVAAPLGVYAISGPGILPSLMPSVSQHDPRQATVTVHVASVCRSPLVYQFIPLRFEGYPGYDPIGKLFLYEWPEPDQTYGLGVDTSDGIGEDATVIEGFRKGAWDRPHGQVCEFASPYIKADQLWPMALALGAFFSPHQSKQGRAVQCRICVECRGNGEVVQDELKKRGWWNFHPWKRYDNKKRQTNATVHKEGIFTNVWFRSMMMDKLLTAIDEEALLIGSPWLVDEFATLVRDPEMESARADNQSHDDRVMGIGFPLFSLTVDDLPSQQTYRRTLPQYLPDALEGGPSYAVYRPPIQSGDLSALSPVSIRGRSAPGPRRFGYNAARALLARGSRGR